MPTYKIDIGPVEDFLTVNTDDMDSLTYEDGSTDPITGTFYGLRTSLRIQSLGIDVSGSDSDDPLVLENGVPIKWKTVGGTKRAMIRLNSSDTLVIGNDAAEGSEELRFDLENITGAMNLDAIDGLVFDGDTAFIRLPHHASGPATPANGHIWTESDGVHVYISGVESVLGTGGGAFDPHSPGPIGDVTPDTVDATVITANRFYSDRTAGNPRIYGFKTNNVLRWQFRVE